MLVAVAGVAFALLAGLQSAPAGAWRGDLLMVAAAVTMACYSIGSRPVIRRSSPMAFTAMGVGVGALCLTGGGWWHGSLRPVLAFGTPEWLATAYLGLFGGAITFFLWSYALSRTTPTIVAISVTVNPIAAALVGAMVLDEPIGWPLVVGLAAVFAGIWLATAAPDGPSRASA